MDVPKKVNSEIRDSMLPHQILFWEIIEAKKRGDIDTQLEDDSENNIDLKNEEWYE